jgi:hypothetical protein
MPKAANALHRDQISAAQTGVPKSVVSRDTCAKEGRRVHGGKLVRNGSDGACFSDHHFRISTVDGYPGYHRILTIHAVSAPAGFADAVFAGDQADTDPLTEFPSRHSVAQGVDAAHDFMARDAR